MELGEQMVGFALGGSVGSAWGSVGIIMGWMCGDAWVPMGVWGSIGSLQSSGGQWGSLWGDVGGWDPIGVTVVCRVMMGVPGDRCGGDMWGYVGYYGG